MEEVQFSSYEALNSSLIKQFPNISLKPFETMRYVENMSHFFGLIFYSLYFFLFLVRGKTFLIFEHCFWFIFIFQIMTFGSALVTQKISFLINNVKYFTYHTSAMFPTYLVTLCDKVVYCQVPMYWFVITAFLVVQIVEFSEQNIHALKFAHIYLIPIVLIVLLVSMRIPEHMEVVMIVVCFLTWWIYRKHMVAQLYSQEMSRTDILNLRRMNIWVSFQIFATFMYLLLKFGTTQAIKSSIADNERLVFFTLWKDEMFRGVKLVATYANASLFSWATIHLIKSESLQTADQSALPVFIGSPLQLESLSRRPSTISRLSANNVAPHNIRDSTMLHI